MGDDTEKSKSVQLAALSAALQLNRFGVVRISSLFKIARLTARSLTILPKQNLLPRPPPSRFQIRV